MGFSILSGGITGVTGSVSADVINSLGADPNADRIVFWDDSAGALKYLTVGSGLSITATTITATAQSPGMVLMYAVQGSFTDTTEAQIWTKTFIASDFSANDRILVIMSLIEPTAVRNVTIGKVRVVDSATTFDTADLCPDSAYHNIEVGIIQRQDASTKLAYDWKTCNSAGALNSGINIADMTDTNWITTAFTLSGRACLSGAGTGYFKVLVYKLTSV